MSAQDISLRLVLVLLLISLNAFFVTAEFAMVYVRRSRIAQLVQAGDLQAQTVQSLQRSLDRLLSTTQLGITLSSIALGWIGEETIGLGVKKLIISLPLGQELANRITHSVAIPLAFIIVVYLQIVLGELCPKSLALIYSEQLARFLAPPIGVISQIFYPFILILNHSTRCLLRCVGVRDNHQRSYPRLTSEELQLIIETEEESTGLEAEERQLLSNVLEFSDVTASEVMVPRTQLVCIPRSADFATLLQEVTSTGFSRYPVYGDSMDEILGLVDFKDLALPLAQGHLSLETAIENWLKPIPFVPESTPLRELLALMQRSQLKMVMVVDEFGGISGLVTLEDLIAQILGDGAQQCNLITKELQIIDENTFIVKAQMNLEELNAVLGLELPLNDEYQTLGGFLIYQWEKIPTEGETLDYEGLEFTVLSVDGPRLAEIRLRSPQEINTKDDELNGYHLKTKNPTEN